MDEDYNDILLKARRTSATIRQRTIDDLVDLYIRMLSGIKGSSPEQISEVFRSLLNQYGKDFMSALLKATRETAGVAAKAHQAATELVLTSAGVNLAVSFNDIPTAALEAMQSRRLLAEKYGLKGFSGFFRTVIQRGLKDIADQVDDLLFEAVATGESAGSLTKRLAKMLAQNEPDVLAALEKLGSNGGRIRNAVLDDSVEALGEARSLLKRSKLIAVHEINSAYLESDVMASIRSPVVGALRRRLSGNHPVVDVCDILVGSDTYGMGAGVYPPNYAASLAHPRCRDWYEKILRHPSMFLINKAPLPSSFRLITFESASPILNKGRAVGAGFSRRQIELANNLNRAAFEAESVFRSRAA